MYLIVHVTHTERNAEAEPTKQKAKEQTNYPGQSTWGFFDICESVVPTVMALDDNWAYWPVIVRVLWQRGGLMDHDSGRWGRGWCNRDDLGYRHLGGLLMIRVHDNW